MLFDELASKIIPNVAFDPSEFGKAPRSLSLGKNGGVVPSTKSQAEYLVFPFMFGLGFDTD